MSQPPRTTVVAIPARDEADHIDACLAALIADAVLPPDDVLVLVNNSSDTTAARTSTWSGVRATRLHVVECDLGQAEATAGHARRRAVQLAAAIAGPDGIVATTDADARVDPDWLAASCSILAGGIDLVAGWVELEPLDWAAIPIRLHEDDAREAEYDLLCDHIHHMLDPDPHDPLPRHTQTSGASLAMTAASLAACGGIPATPNGEDRALVAAMRRIDARIRHAPEIHAHVSGRTTGRARGGMADTIARRLLTPDLHLDDRLEPVATVVLRATVRRRTRALHATGRTPDQAAIADLARTLSLDPPAILRAINARHFGEAWHALAAASPRLAPHPVPVAHLAREVAAARAVIATLDARPSPRPAMAANA